MRLKMLFALTIIALAAIAVIGINPQRAVEADALLQSLPDLSGANIYFTEANGESSRFDQLNTGLSRFAGLLRRQGANLYTLEWRTRFPADADLIIVAGPLADFPPDQTARLWAYITNGGRLLLLANPVVQTTGANQWTQASGFFALMWNDMSVRGRNDVAVTEFSQLLSDEEATEEPTQGVGLIARFSTTNLNPDHPITASLDDPLHFFVARSVQYDSSLRDYQVTPLVTTDSTFYGEMAYADYLSTRTFNYDVGTDRADTARGPLALAAALEDPRTGTRIVLIGDREFATNAGGFETSPPGSPSFVYPANVRFMMNSVTWLLDAAPLDLSFPTAGPTATVTITPTPTSTATPTPVASPTVAATDES